MVNSEAGLSMLVSALLWIVCVLLSRAQKNSWESWVLFAYTALTKMELSLKEFIIYPHYHW